MEIYRRLRPGDPPTLEHLRLLLRETLFLRWLWNTTEAGVCVVAITLLLALFIAVAETGRAFYIAISVSNAARAGVQYGAQNLATAADNAMLIDGSV